MWFSKITFIDLMKSCKIYNYSLWCICLLFALYCQTFMTPNDQRIWPSETLTELMKKRERRRKKEFLFLCYADFGFPCHLLTVGTLDNKYQDNEDIPKKKQVRWVWTRWRHVSVESESFTLCFSWPPRERLSTNALLHGAVALTYTFRLQSHPSSQRSHKTKATWSGDTLIG